MIALRPRLVMARADTSVFPRFSVLINGGYGIIGRGKNRDSDPGRERQSGRIDLLCRHRPSARGVLTTSATGSR